MSPNLTFAPHQRSHNLLTEQVLDDPAITYDVAPDALVIAVKGELLASRSARIAHPQLERELGAVATRSGSLSSRELAPGHQRVATTASQLYEPDPDGPAGDVELWRLNDPAYDSIDQARRLAKLAPPHRFVIGGGPVVELPAVSPNHACVVSGHWGTCPAGPPYPALSPSRPFLAPSHGLGARVVVIDTGYIAVHPELTARVLPISGESWDVTAAPPAWTPDPPDQVTLDIHGRLVEVTGHGTFIAGLIAHHAPGATITSVGQRDDVFPLDSAAPGERLRIYASEFSIAHSMLLHAETDVIQCGFSFPTLDDHPPLALTAAVGVLAGGEAPRQGVAIVAPAGNEESARRYWPAALPGVIGVAATDRRARARAWFSNWGEWADCCTRGEYVFSTYIDYTGAVEGEPDATFTGWARWDGTSFAAPKVSAAIARRVAQTGDTPIDAWAALVADPGVTNVTDHVVAPGVTLPQLMLG